MFIEVQILKSATVKLILNSNYLILNLLESNLNFVLMEKSIL